MPPKASGESMFDTALIENLVPENQDPFEALAAKADAAIEVVARGSYDAEDLTSVLQAWKHCHDIQQSIVPKEQDAYEQRNLWFQKAEKYSNALIYCMGGAGSVLGLKANDNIDKLAEFVTDIEFDGRGELVEYLSYKLFSTYQLVESAKPRYLDEIPRPFLTEARKAFEQEQQVLLPLVEKGLIALSYENNRQSLRASLEFLNASGLKETSDQVLLAVGLDDTSRLNYAIENINTYGFIVTIETLSAHADTNPSIKSVYEKLQGSQVEKVMKDLWQVYEEYEKTANFGEYYEDEVTLKDVSVVEKALPELERLFGKTRGELNVVSLAAGKGRMPIALAKKGFTNIVAVEPQHNYVEAMRNVAQSQNVVLKYVEKTWDDIKVEDLGFEITAKDYEAMDADADYLAAVGGDENAIKLIGRHNLAGAELIESTGRNLPHANSPQKLFIALDSIKEISKDGAIVVIDVMDPYSGRYKTIIDGLATNLVELGVDEQKAHFSFEGPSNSLKFNRMTVNEEQMQAYCKLLGFKILSIDISQVGEGDDQFNNVYYTLQSDTGFHPATLEWEETVEALKFIGLTSAGVDYNEMVDTWGMTIGQAILFSLDSEKVRAANEAGNVKKVYVKRRGSTVDLQGVKPN